MIICTDFIHGEKFSTDVFFVDCRSVTVLVDSGEILLTVKQSDKADKTLVLTVSNKTGADIFIGRAFRLEKFEDGIWKDVDFRVGANKFTEEAIVVRSGGETVLNVALESYFDGIEQGKYRISKQIFSSYVICAEFTFDAI